MKGLFSKKVWIALIGASLTLGTCMSAAAAGSISNVRLTFTDVYGEEGEILEPAVSVSDSRYSIESVSWPRAAEKWTPGKKVTATVSLTAEGGNQFAGSYSKSNCKVYGADYSSNKVVDQETMTVKANYVPVVRLGETERAGWGDTTRTRAVWKKVDFATAYQVKLYSDGRLIKTLTVENNNVDLTPYLKNEASYYYEVKATSRNSSESKYLKDGGFVQSDDQIMDNLGDTSGTWRDYQAGSKYRDMDGNYVTNSWKLISGKWYYFNNEGYAMTGWQYLNNRWYYLNADGVMQTGWAFVNDKWYYLNSTGDMAFGWIQPQPECWYYLDSTGTMQTGWIQNNGRWYYLDSNGLMAANTTVDGYQIGEDGARIQ